MLNASAKEFVPLAVSPRASAPAAPQSQCASGCGGDSPVGGGAKAQLSPAAPVFVPRAASCAGAGGGAKLLETRPSDPSDPSDAPRSVLTPPPSDSDLSSSAASRGEADGCGWAVGGGEGAEGEVEQPWAGFEAVQGNETYDSYGGEQGGYEDCYGAYSPACGEVLPGKVIPQAGSGAYDTYSYGMYEGYATQYGVGACDVDPQQGAPAVYYETSYDDTAACYESYPQGMYYWDEAAGAYVYNEAEYGCEYGNWQQYENGMASTQPLPEGDASCQPVSPAGQAQWGAATAVAADAELSLEMGLLELSGEGGGSVSGEQLRSMAKGDATELLEMFFPHYAGEALSRLLERTNGDLLAAFAELAAMERQVGVERAAASASAGGRGPVQARGGGSGGGRGPGAGRGAGGGRKRPGSGAAGFKLDLEAFPSLPASPASPAKPAQPATTPTPPATTGAEAAAPQSTQPSNSADGHADAAATAAAPTIPDRPNFATLLRSSATAAAASSSGPCSDPRAAGGAQSRDDSGATSGSGRSSSRDAGRGAGARGPSAAEAAARLARGGSAAPSSVPRVTTGEAVAGQYAEERRDAAMLARARNQYFQQATLAYLSGNKALAKELGRKGRELNEAMKAAHAAAAQRIFAQRNAPHQLQNRLRNGAKPQQPQSEQQLRQPQRRQGASAAASSSCPDGTGGSGEGPRRQQQQQAGANPPSQPPPAGGDPEAAGDVLFVDLHGLHAAEAVAMLEAQIEEARAAGCRLLRVCTGTGSHTKGARTPARLPAAVADTLLSNHLTFKTLKPGLLEARL